MAAPHTSASCAVYTTYDVKHPPPHPGPEWTRFVCISDTHSQRFAIPPGDVLLHAGDLTAWGYLRQLRKDIQWLRSLPHPTKILIAGNHDLCLDDDWVEGGKMAEKAGEGIAQEDWSAAIDLVANADDIHYLEYNSFRFTTANGRTWEVYGSPAVPRHVLGAFQYETSQEARKIYDSVPPTTEILLTHTPPHGMHDLTKKNINAGCRVLTARMADLGRCRLHVFGHIHEARGATVSALEASQARVSVNAAMPDTGRAIIVDLLN